MARHSSIQLDTKSQSYDLVKTNSAGRGALGLRSQQLVEQEGVGTVVLFRLGNSANQQVAFLSNALALFFHLHSVNGMMNSMSGVL